MSSKMDVQIILYTFCFMALFTCNIKAQVIKLQKNFLSAEIQTLLDMEVLDSETVSFVQERDFFPQANCSRILKEFSSTAASYTLCGASFARPVNLCLQCKDRYLDVIEKYKDMDKYKQDNVTCREVLTKQDKLNIVTSVYNFITDENSIWSLGNCNNCYKDHDLSKGISQEAETYIQKLQQTWNCFNNFTYLALQNSSTNFTALCNNCTDTYFETRKYFWGTLVPSSKLGDYGAVCIDLKDAFNFTGYIWGIEFRCNSDLEMGGFWILILIPCGLLITLTYGIPTFFVPWWKGSSHKILNLLAIPDHYDSAESEREVGLSNVKQFIVKTRNDAEESLSVKADENIDLQDELFKLVEVLQVAKSNQFKFHDEKELHDVLETMTEILTVFMRKSGHEVSADKSPTFVPFREYLRQRKVSRRGLSSEHPQVNWEDFGPYLEIENTQESMGAAGHTVEP